MKPITRRSFVALAAASAMALAGCSSEPEPQQEPEPVSYVGSWVERDHGDSWQEATVTEGRIEVYWMEEDSKSLYWAGTFDAEGDGVKVSENDVEVTSKAMLASGDETKDFDCADGVISYEVTALGVTKTVHLVKQA